MPPRLGQNRSRAPRLAMKLPRFAILLVLVSLAAALRGADASSAAAPLRVVLAGLAHGHAGGFLRQADPAIVQLVGVWEPDDTIWEKYRKNARLAHVPRHRELAD